MLEQLNKTEVELLIKSIQSGPSQVVGFEPDGQNQKCFEMGWAAAKEQIWSVLNTIKASREEAAHPEQVCGIELHSEPVKSWLLYALVAQGDTGISIHDHPFQEHIRCLFSDETLDLPVLADELYVQGIVSLRAAEIMYLSSSIRRMIQNCITENRQPTW